jgi:hypothetical protein
MFDVRMSMSGYHQFLKIVCKVCTLGKADFFTGRSFTLQNKTKEQDLTDWNIFVESCRTL